MKRWRQRHPEARREERRKNYAATRGGHATGLRWGQEEDRLLFDFEGTDRELSAKIGRSVQAIQIRRSRIRPVTP